MSEVWEHTLFCYTYMHAACKRKGEYVKRFLRASIILWCYQFVTELLSICLLIIILFSFGEFFSNNEFQYDEFRPSRRWI